LKGKEELGFVHMDESFKIKLPPESDNPESKLCFVFSTNIRSLLVKAPSEQIKDEWVGTLEAIREEENSKTNIRSNLDGFLIDQSAGMANPWGEEEQAKFAVDDKSVLLEHLGTLTAASSTPATSVKVNYKTHENSIIEGYLSKKGGKLRNWRMRYFVLLPNALHYYKDPRDKKLQGVVLISQDTVVMAHELPHTFSVCSKGEREYVITASDFKEQLRWMRAFDKAADGVTIVEPRREDYEQNWHQSPTASVLLATKTNSRSLKEGYLLKLGQKVASWRRRYFVLLPDRLEYYRNNIDKKPVGSIPLDANTTASFLETIKHAFSITTVAKSGRNPLRSTVFCAVNDDERERWLKELKKAVGGKIQVTFAPRDTLESKDADTILSCILKSEGKTAEKVQAEFVEFCRERYAEENALFCMAVNKYRQIPCVDGAPEQVRAAQDIYDRFLKSGAEEEVCIAAPVLGVLKSNLARKRPRSSTSDVVSALRPSQQRISQSDPDPVLELVVDRQSTDLSKVSSRDLSRAIGTTFQPTMTTISDAEDERTSSSIQKSRLPLSPQTPATSATSSQPNATSHFPPSHVTVCFTVDPDTGAVAVTIEPEARHSASHFNPELDEEDEEDDERVNVTSSVFNKAYQILFSGLRDLIMPKYLLHIPESAVASWALDVLEEQNTSVTSGVSVQTLMNILTNAAAKLPYDILDFRRSFLLNLHTMTTPEELLDHIAKVYAEPMAGKFASSIHQKTHILGTLEEWVINFFEDFDQTQSAKLVALLQEWRKQVDTFMADFLEQYKKKGNSHTGDPSVVSVGSLDSGDYAQQSLRDTPYTFVKKEFNRWRAKIENLASTVQAKLAELALAIRKKEETMLADRLVMGLSGKPNANANKEKIPNLDDKDTKSASQLKQDVKLQEEKEEADVLSRMTPPAKLICKALTTDLLSTSPKQLASWLTIFDAKYYDAIRPREFVRKAWTSPDSATLAPNILKMVSNFNKRSLWVATEVLNQVDVAQASKVIGHFIKVTQHLHSLKNFYAVFAITSGLGVQPVFRLKAAWTKLSNKEKAAFNTLKTQVTSSAKSWTGYRQLFRKGLGGAQLAHLAIVLRDCFLLEEIPTLNESGAVNYHKFEKQYLQLKDFFQSQAQTYHLHELAMDCDLFVLGNSGSGSSNSEHIADMSKGEFSVSSNSEISTKGERSLPRSLNQRQSSMEDIQARELKVNLEILQPALKLGLQAATFTSRLLQEDQMFQRSNVLEPKK